MMLASNRWLSASVHGAVKRSIFVLIAVLLCSNGYVVAQPTGLAAMADPLLGDELVEIRMGSPVKLEAVLQFMTANLATRYQYSAVIGSKPVSIQTPTKLPKKALPFLLSSVLRSENLAIVEGDTPGEKRIIESSEMAKYAPIGVKGDAEKVFQEKGAGAPATQVFELKKLTSDSVGPLLKNFSPSSINLAVPNSNILIVTDYANNIKKIDDLVTMIDSPVGETVYKFYEVKNQASKDLTEQVQLIFGQRISAARDGGRPNEDGLPADAGPPSDGGQSPGAAKSIRLFDDAKRNRIVVVGRADLVDEALGLLQQFDVELGMKTLVYRPKNLSAERLNKIIEGYIPEQDVKRAYQGTVDEDGNMLIVRATGAIHQQIQTLLDELDKTTAVSDSPIRIYTLKNARASDVLLTLLALQEAYGSSLGGALGGLGGNPFFGGAFGGLGIPGFSNGLLGNGGFGGLNALGGGMGGFGMGGFGGMGQFGNPGVITQQLPLQPGQPTTLPGTTTGVGGTGSTTGSRSGRQQGQGLGNQSSFGGGLAAGGAATLPGGARVSADIGTNSLLVVAPASIQPVYEKLIKSLDTRRPQVMIEAKLIAVDTTDGFTLGIETSAGDREGAVRAFKFTSYGLSTVSANGNLTLTPGRGFNGTIVDPEVADIVVRALANHSRSRVLSEPKLLVNNNDTGTLTSVVSVPFSSVNASNTVSTTSLGGTQEAGTTITVTPQINEDDNLQLEFEIEFSSFSGSGTATLPPARQIQTVSSVITIPDGQTVIVGGLKRIGARQEYAGIPWIEKIPIIRDLTGRTDESKETTSYFVFIRPLILRDSRFQDLQYMSDRDSGLAGIPSGYPGSQPLLMG